MDTSIFDSFKENIFQKTKNPLLATIIIVWTFKNWRLVYALFNFDEGIGLNERIKYIESYYLSVNFYENLFLAIGYAFLVLIITYSLLAASRLIVNFYDKFVTPHIYKWTDGTSIVLKTDYEKVLNDNSQLENKLKSERSNRIEAQSESEELEKKVREYASQLEPLKQTQVDFNVLSEHVGKIESENTHLKAEKAQLLKLKEKNSELKDNYSILSKEHDELIAQKQDYINSQLHYAAVQKENASLKEYKENALRLKEEANILKDKYDQLVKSVEKQKALDDSPYPAYFDESTIRSIKKLESETKYYAFRSLGAQLLNNEPVKKVNEETRYFTSLGLIYPSSEFEYNNEYSFYELTEKGKNVFEYFNEIKY